MTIYLYVKQCNHCNLKYFGKTVQEPSKYRGSGKFWIRHLNKHKSTQSTIQTWSFEDQEECSVFALKFSKENNIVESRIWANLIEETGTDGGLTTSYEDQMKIWTPEFRQTHSELMKTIQTKEVLEKKSQSAKSHWACLSTDKKSARAHKMIETKRKTGFGNVGKNPKTAEQKASMSKVASLKVQCLVCGKETNRGNLKRWHQH